MAALNILAFELIRDVAMILLLYYKSEGYAPVEQRYTLLSVT